MKKLILSILAVVLLVLMMVSCGDDTIGKQGESNADFPIITPSDQPCTHEAVIDPATEATCTIAGKTEGSHCSKCGKVLQAQEDIPANGHDFSAATCTKAQTCNLCGVTDGESLGHSYDEATCTAPKTCKRCNDTDGQANGHEFEKATCVSASKCKNCGTAKGTALGHCFEFPEGAACTDRVNCTRCNVKGTATLGHLMVEATCTEPSYCSRCGKEEGAPRGHYFMEADCYYAKTCLRCDITEGQPLAHQYTDATCTNSEYCILCWIEGDKALGHNYKNGQCTRCKQDDPEVLLENLHVIDQNSYNGLKKNFTDTFGYTYNKAFEYHQGNYNERSVFSIYSLKRMYSKFSGSFVSGNDMNDSVTFEIYVDDERVFSFEGFTKTTEKIDFEIDVVGASKLEIRSNSGYHYTTHFAIVDVKLAKAQ